MSKSQADSRSDHTSEGSDRAEGNIDEPGPPRHYIELPAVDAADYLESDPLISESAKPGDEPEEDS